MIGADAEQLEALARRLDEHAARLRAGQGDIGAALSGVFWSGVAALRFRADWDRVHRRALGDAAADLASTADGLRAQARQQRDASGDAGTGGRAQGPRGDRRVPDPMPVERPHRFLFFTWGEGEMPRVDLDDTPLFEGPGSGIDVGDARQGSIGDCYLIAALASMAATAEGRARIEQIIHDNGDGTFTVTFGDGSQVTVDDEFYADQEGNQLYARSREDLWVAVVEEAYARKHGGYGDIVGGFGSDVMSELGLPADRFAVQDISDRQLEQVVTSGHPVTFGADLDRSGGIQSSYEGNHEFSVISTQRGPGGELLVTARNPWGSNEGLRFPPGVQRGPDGTFTCTLDQLRAIAHNISVAR